MLRMAELVSDTIIRRHIKNVEAETNVETAMN